MNSEYIKVFRAFTDESRVRVLEILCEGEECACFLLEDLKISQPTLSHHMKILCESGIVKSRKEGKWNYYSINESGCRYASKLLEKVMKKHMHDIITIASKIFGKTGTVKKALGLSSQEQENTCTCGCSYQNGKQ